MEDTKLGGEASCTLKVQDGLFIDIAMNQQDIPVLAIQVTVTETGWPTAESSMADSGSARKFTAGIVRASVHGTPLRPGRMDIYLFELFDERHKTGERHEKHFGLFDFEGNPKRG